MPVVLAGALLVLVLCSGARLVKPAAHAYREGVAPVDVEVWHGLMGLAMVVMLLTGLSQGESRTAGVVFAAGVVWCVVRMTGHAARAAYLRLGACCTAMLVMLVPTALAGGSAAAPMGGMAGMAGMDMPGTADLGSMRGMQAGTLPPVVVGVLLVAMAGVVGASASRIALPRVKPYGAVPMHRMQAFGEMAMAGAMAYMLVGLA